MSAKISIVFLFNLDTVERKKPLNKIKSLFESENSKPKIVAIVGNSATGKSELARQYTKKYQDAYQDIWHIHGAGWDLSYRNLALHWQLFSAEAIKDEPIFYRK